MSVKLGNTNISSILGSSGAATGTTDYTDLTNKPSINGIPLVGNKTTSDLGITISPDNYYTKAETDARINTELEAKASIDDVYDKAEIDTKLSNAENSTNSKLATKADKATTYTKTETDEAINTAIADRATITYVDTELTNKADKATTYTKTEVDNLITSTGPTGDTLPIGSVVNYSGQTTPENWLLCDGREVSRTVYSQLFNIIGTMYGPGDGSTSFNLPNLTSSGQNYIIKAKQSAGVVATVVDTLTSTSAVDALSANQGRVIDAKIAELAPTTLYENANGSNENILLSNDISNYSYLEIYYSSSNKAYITSSKIPTSTSNFVLFTSEAWGNGNTEISSARYSISGTTISPMAGSKAVLSNGVSSSNTVNVYIQKVLGIK